MFFYQKIYMFYSQTSFRFCFTQIPSPQRPSLATNLTLQPPFQLGLTLISPFIFLLRTYGHLTRYMLSYVCLLLSFIPQEYKGMERCMHCLVLYQPGKTFTAHSRGSTNIHWLGEMCHSLNVFNGWELHSPLAFVLEPLFSPTRRHPPL